MNDRIVLPGGTIGSFGSADEARGSLEAHRSPGIYDIIGGHSTLWLPGYTAPPWGIATKDRDGVVGLIPDFRRQAAGPR